MSVFWVQSAQGHSIANTRGIRAVWLSSPRGTFLSALRMACLGSMWWGPAVLLDADAVETAMWKHSLLLPFVITVEVFVCLCWHHLKYAFCGQQTRLQCLILFGFYFSSSILACSPQAAFYSGNLDMQYNKTSGSKCPDSTLLSVGQSPTLGLQWTKYYHGTLGRVSFKISSRLLRRELKGLVLNVSGKVMLVCWAVACGFVMRSKLCTNRVWFSHLWPVLCHVSNNWSFIRPIRRRTGWLTPRHSSVNKEGVKSWPQAKQKHCCKMWGGRGWTVF